MKMQDPAGGAHELRRFPISPTPHHSASAPRLCPPHYFTAGNAPDRSERKIGWSRAERSSGRERKTVEIGAGTERGAGLQK